jgi:hypothetical protein
MLPCRIGGMSGVGFACVSAIEPVLQDRGDRAVGGGADVVAAPGGRFHPGRAVAAREPQDAEAGAEALLGMRLGPHDRLDEGNGRRADLPRLVHHPRRRPLGVTAMRARHVLAHRGVAVMDA